MANVVRDESIVTIRAVEALGVATLSALRSVTTPIVLGCRARHRSTGSTRS